MPRAASPGLEPIIYESRRQPLTHVAAPKETTHPRHQAETTNTAHGPTHMQTSCQVALPGSAANSQDGASPTKTLATPCQNWPKQSHPAHPRYLQAPISP